jgi:hypothetical protein
MGLRIVPRTLRSSHLSKARLSPYRGATEPDAGPGILIPEATST